MHTRGRLLFIRPRKNAGLAPIYIALVILISVSLLQFALALWPHAAPGPPEGKAAGTSQSSDKAVRLPADGRSPPLRRSWT